MFNNKKDDNKYYVITEQGDLGLGADVLNESDQKVIEKKKLEDQKKQIKPCNVKIQK